MIELERTFLAKSIPKDIASYKSREIIDIYVPKMARHPTLRIRKNGDKYEITKKQPINNDASKQTEETIPLTKEEFETLSLVDGKKSRKIRHLKQFQDYTIEIDVYQDELKGLVLVDFEFRTEKEKDNFNKPDFCLADVTQEEFIAGGMLPGKTYKDIEEGLKRFNYKKLNV